MFLFWRPLSTTLLLHYTWLRFFVPFYYTFYYTLLLHFCCASCTFLLHNSATHYYTFTHIFITLILHFLATLCSTFIHILRQRVNTFMSTCTPGHSTFYVPRNIFENVIRSSNIIDIYFKATYNLIFYKF